MSAVRNTREMIVWAVAVVLVAGACGFSTNEESEQVVGTWTLVRVEVGGVDQPIGADVAPTSITFLGDGRFEGQAPCNDFAGLWSHTGDGLGVSGLTQSAVACVGPDGGSAVMDAERLIMGALFEAGRFDMRRDGEVLELAARSYTLIWSAAG